MVADILEVQESSPPIRSQPEASPAGGIKFQEDLVRCSLRIIQAFLGTDLAVM